MATNFKDEFITAPIGNKTVVLQKQAKQQEAIFDKIMSHRYAAFKKDHEDRQKFEEKLNKELIKLQKDLEKAQEASRSKVQTQALQDSLRQKEANVAAKQAEIEEQKKLDEEYAKFTEQVKREAATIACDYELNSYKRMSADKRREYSKTVYTQLKSGETFRKSELAKETAHIKELEKRRAKVKDKRGAGKAENETLKKEIKEAQFRQQKLQKEQQLQDTAQSGMLEFSKKELLFDPTKIDAKRKANLEANTERLQDATNKRDAAKSRVDDLEAEWAKKNEKRAKEIQKAKEALQKSDTKANRDELKRLEEQEKRARDRFEKQSGLVDAQEELDAAEEELVDAKKKTVKDTLQDNLEEGLSKAAEKVGNAITSNLDSVYGQQGRMRARLQGSGLRNDWKLLVGDVMLNVGMSGVVSQKSVVEKMTQLVDSGVAYNLELRAFLASTAENIASTFDAANGTLLRLIRTQQADTTTARLGMEATLTELFNKYFKDTSYLSDVKTSGVATTLFDAMSTMSRDEAVEFEFDVNKWLGSLYSLGMSSEGVNLIAQGLNYLGTGNVSALSGNSALQTLFAMSASKSGGKSYAQLLTGGLTSEDTNKLLKSMVEYLAQIAGSQTNLVTKQAYADLFGMSLTDFNSFTSLTQKEIESLYKTTVSYENMVDETGKQLRQTLLRVSVSDMIDTMIENVEMSAAMTIGSNPITYGTWKALNLVSDYVGKVPIPGILAAGFGISSEIDLVNVAKTAMVGLGLVGSVVSGIASIAQGGATNLNNWMNMGAYSEYTTRGSTLSMLDASTTNTDTSYSAMIGTGSASGEDVENTSLQSAQDTAMESSGTTSEEMDEQKEIPQKILDAVTNDDQPIIKLLTGIDTKLAPDRVFYTALTGMVNSGNVARLESLSTSVTTLSNIKTSNVVAESQESKETPATSVTNSGTESGKDSVNTTSEVPLLGMEDIIRSAVTAAVSAVLDAYSTSGIPVQLRNVGGIF